MLENEQKNTTDNEEVPIERVQGQAFNVKRRKRSDVEKERPLNIAKIEALKGLEKEQYVVTIDIPEFGEQDIVVNPIAPAQLILIGSTIFLKSAEISAEILKQKGIDLDTPEGDKYFDDSREAFMEASEKDPKIQAKFNYDRKIMACLISIEEPDWITEEILRSLNERYIDEIFETANEGVIGQDAVSAFPSDDTEPEATS